MKQLSDQEPTAQINDIQSFDEQMPCVGTFWYDAGTRASSHVRKMEITPRMVEEARQTGQTSILHLKEDGPMNGRIIWHADNSIVRLGRWPELVLRELTEMLGREFSLPYFEVFYVTNLKRGNYQIN